MEGGPQPHLPAARCPSTTTTRHELVTYIPSMTRTFASLPPSNLSVWQTNEWLGLERGLKLPLRRLDFQNSWSVWVFV